MMGKTRWLARGASRTLLLLLVALVAAMVAVPGGPAEAASKKKPPGDPPGNNGTIKIEQGNETNSDLGNEPHGDNCEIWVEFYGFDAGPEGKGQTADITFALQPPTKPKDSEVVFRAPDDKSKPGYTISTDAAGGGPNDPEETYTYSFKLTDAMKGIEPHPKQGYHVKLSVDVREAPGNSKHKVFWMAPCAPEEQQPPTSAAASTLRIAKAQEGAGQGPYTFDLNCDHSPLNQTFTLKAGEKLDIANVPAGTTCAVTETDKKGAESVTITEDPAFGAADDGTVKTTAEKSTIVTFKNKFQGTEVVAAPPNEDIRPPAGTPAGSGGSPGTSVGGNTATNPDASVLGATETAPEAAATLPRTGTDPGPLTATGLSALATGVALLAGGRRRRA